ncbi:tail sheath protein [Microcystis phage vB_MweS-yong2]|nr:tail sheath protein [Microcystis phage vB_MweS-yong2]
MGVLFNFIPGSSSFRAPGRYIEINSGGQPVFDTATLIQGVRGSNGLTLWSGEPILCPSIEEAARLAGIGTPLYEMYRVARLNDPVGEIWIQEQPVTGTAAQHTITLATLPATGGDWSLEIAGRRISGTAAAGETLATTATNVAAAINAYVDPLQRAYLPVTAAAALGVITLTARTPGAFTSALDIWTDPMEAANIFGPAGRFTVANSVPGAGVLTNSAQLAALGDKVFGLVIGQASDTAAFTAARAAFNQTSGRWSFDAPLFGIYAACVTGNVAAQTTAGLGPNSMFVSIVGRVSTPSPDYEFAAGYFTAQTSWLYDDAGGNVGRNQTGRPILGVRAPRARSAWPQQTTVRNSLINAGVSTWKVGPSGDVVVDKCVTTRRLNDQGQPDIEFAAIQRMFQAQHFVRLWLAEMSYRSANRATAAANPANVATIYTPADGKADAIAIFFEAERRGLIEAANASARRVTVEIDGANPSRMNFGMDVDGVDPLDILAAAVTFRRLA